MRPAKRRDGGTNAVFKPDRGLPAEFGAQQIGRTDQPGLVILAHVYRAKA